MATLAELAAALDKDIANKAIFDAIINGPASGEGSTVVINENLTVPTVAKSLADMMGDTPSYATLELANAGEPLGTIFKNTTTNKLEITTA